MEFLVATDALKEEPIDKLRLAAFPVWLESGKKGLRFSEFLRRIGLSKDPPARKSKKLDRAQLSRLYAQAEKIKSQDLKG